MKNKKNNYISEFIEYIKDIRLYSNHTVRSYEYDLYDLILLQFVPKFSS